MADPTHETVPVPLSVPAALVLLNWLQREELEKLPLDHPSERQALADLLFALESAVAEPTEDELLRARSTLLRSAGPWVYGERDDTNVE
jgi:hypothetical protein